jgi:ABC-type Zn uptake system ZnuABC Zn-binding protein ZnuA
MHRRSTNRRAGRVLAVPAALVLALAACGDDAASDSNVDASTTAPTAAPAGTGSPTADTCPSGPVVEGRPVRIVTTVAPLTSIAANIAGDKAQVTGLVPEGVNSHTFEPPPSAAEALAEADVVFVNGLGLEDPTMELAEANMPNGGRLCELGTTILPEDEWIYDLSFPKEGGKPNPHLWTNPPMGADYAGLIMQTLSERDPANAATYSANFAAFSARIAELDAAMATATATVDPANRKLLTYHDAYAYFAVHYGWEVIGAIQPSSFDEPTAKDVADLIDQVKADGVPAIFGSEVFPSPVLEQIGKEAGVRYVDVLRDDDLPGAPGEPEHSWLGLMRFDYVTMVEALGGDASVLRAVDVSDVVPDAATYPQ